MPLRGKGCPYPVARGKGCPCVQNRFATALLQLDYCFTAAVLLLYYFFTTALLLFFFATQTGGVLSVHAVRGNGSPCAQNRFTTALLLLYYCFTTVFFTTNTGGVLSVHAVRGDGPVCAQDIGCSIPREALPVYGGDGRSR